MRKTLISTLRLGTLSLLILLIMSPGICFSRTPVVKEGRAVWLHSNMFSMEKEEALSQLKEVLDSYAEIGINHLFCFNVMQFQHQRDWDFLQTLLDESHKRSINVHPIFFPGHRLKLTGVIKEHPEWLIRGRNGEIYPHLNLANPETRKYIVDKISAALKYNIDGIHLDYIRFPVHQRFSYDKATCDAFKQEYGYSPREIISDCGSMMWCEWIKWNARQVTMLVEEIKNVIIKSGKDIPLSAAVFPDHETAAVLIAQPWAQWAKEGLIDILCPMLYTNDFTMFEKYITAAVEVAQGKCAVYAGIACRSSHNKNTPEGVVQEVNIARKAGADGVVFFSGHSLKGAFITELKKSVFKEQ